MIQDMPNALFMRAVQPTHLRLLNSNKGMYVLQPTVCAAIHAKFLSSLECNSCGPLDT